jgi:hypothetical protein
MRTFGLNILQTQILLGKNCYRAMHSSRERVYWQHINFSAPRSATFCSKYLPKKFSESLSFSAEVFFWWATREDHDSVHI